MVIIREEETTVGPMKELFNLTPASELKVLTEANQMMFKENALKSKAYRRLLETITESSLEGRFEVSFALFTDEDTDVLKVFKGVLENVGYKVIIFTQKTGLFISWY